MRNLMALFLGGELRGKINVGINNTTVKLL
jgi:hypothetical protein